MKKFYSTWVIHSQEFLYIPVAHNNLEGGVLLVLFRESLMKKFYSIWEIHSEEFLYTPVVHNKLEGGVLLVFIQGVLDEEIPQYFRDPASRIFVCVTLNVTFYRCKKLDLN